MCVCVCVSVAGYVCKLLFVFCGMRFATRTLAAAIDLSSSKRPLLLVLKKQHREWALSSPQRCATSVAQSASGGSAFIPQGYTETHWKSEDRRHTSCACGQFEKTQNIFWLKMTLQWHVEWILNDLWRCMITCWSVTLSRQPSTERIHYFKGRNVVLSFMWLLAANPTLKLQVVFSESIHR